MVSLKLFLSLYSCVEASWTSLTHTYNAIQLYMEKEQTDQEML